MPGPAVNQTPAKGSVPAKRTIKPVRRECRLACQEADGFGSLHKQNLLPSPQVTGGIRADKALFNMTSLRHLMAARRRALLAFVLAALGMNALVPAGTMIAPVGQNGAAIMLCPETHPLARALGTVAAPEMAALHAAMGHGQPHHDDHAAMGHAPVPADDPAPPPDPSGTAAQSQSCAFAGLALAALPSEQGEPPSTLSTPLPEPLAFLTRLQLVAPAHLRPPLRAPPALI